VYWDLTSTSWTDVQQNHSTPIPFESVINGISS
jgi:hypothetical protein